jgi:Recombination endonuclease VII
MPAKRKHFLTNVDKDARQGDCSHCDMRVTLQSRDGIMFYCIARSAPKPVRGPTKSPDDRVGAHGLTRAEARRLIKGKACEICQRVAPRMVVDHSHTSGRVRGVLCNDCNLGIGKLGDSASMLKRAIQYLELND